MVDAAQPTHEDPSAPRDEDGDYQRIVDSYFQQLVAATDSPVGTVPPGEASTRGREPLQALRHVLATHYELAVDTAHYQRDLSTVDQDLFRITLAGVIKELLRRVDLAEAGRMVTALSVGTNALRDDTEQFRQTFDAMIADYLTTGEYHESHEGFVTTSLLLEQWLYAMADSTTTAHDILDDAVSSNTRILANLGRGLAYYAERISKLPDSSYRNVGRVMHEQAEPQHLGRLLTAFLTIYNRVAELSPDAHAEAYRRFLSTVDPVVVRTAIRTATDAARDSLAANPELGRALAHSIAAISWSAAKSAARSVLRRRPAARFNG